MAQFLLLYKAIALRGCGAFLSSTKHSGNYMRVYKVRGDIYSENTHTLIYFETMCYVGKNMTRTYDYENDDFDFSYENSGASHEEQEHAETCDWIYSNCTCGLADKNQSEIYFDLREADE